MSKLAKLRNSPETFFADSQSRLVRGLGTILVPRLFSRSLVMEFMEDPGQACEQSGVAALRVLARGHQRWRAERRHALLSAAGFPCVSVVMAAHNAAATIELSIRSVLAQTHAQLELIVVNDASTDRTVEIVERLAASDARLRLVHNPRNLGAAMTRNMGMSHTTGPYLSFHDADDVSHPEKIERQLAALLADPSAVVCVCNFRREFADGSRAIVNGRRFAKNVVSMVFPREPVFDRLGYMLDLRVGEDTEYYERIRTVFGKERAIHLFQTLYLARFAEGSLLFSNGETRVQGGHVTYERSADAQRFLEEILDRMDRIRAGELAPYVALSL